MTKRLEKLIKGIIMTTVVTAVLMFAVHHDSIIEVILDVLTEAFENLGLDYRTADDISAILIIYGIVMITRKVMSLIFKIRVRISLKKEVEEVSE